MKFSFSILERVSGFKYYVEEKEYDSRDAARDASQNWWHRNLGDPFFKPWIYEIVIEEIVP